MIDDSSVTLPELNVLYFALHGECRGGVTKAPPRDSSIWVLDPDGEDGAPGIELSIGGGAMAITHWSPRKPARCLLRTLCTFVTVLPLAAAPAHRQRRAASGGVRRAFDPAIRNIPYDGRFAFARIRYTTGPGGYYYLGLPAWAHGFPAAEHNLMSIVREVTILRPHVQESNVFTLDDPELARYPVAYMTEASFWVLSDREAAAMRAYLLKGGFIIFDDFRDDFRSAGWENFATNMKRVLPEGRFVDLAPSHPIFHAFFDLDSFDSIPQYYDRGPPVFRGLFQDNDPAKRLLVMVNFNTDVSNFWEFSGSGFVPVDESNEGYKLGVNYVIYGLTH